MKNSSIIPIVLPAMLLIHAFASAGDWPQWRGPGGMGLSDEKDLPVKWGGAQNENILWKSVLPKSDTSQSSPVVWKDRVFVTTTLNKPLEHHVTCFQAGDGKQLWDVVVAPGPWILTDLRGGYSCATPATDGERVYVFFGSSLLAALDFEGKEVWRKEITPRNFDVAIATSPILYKDMLIVLCDQNNKTSFLAAYDPKTGAVKYEEKRPTVQFNHTTPLIAQHNGKAQMFISASNALQGVDPDTGKIIWWCASYGDITTPVYANGLVYTDSGRGGVGTCADPSGTGPVTMTHLKWAVKAGTNGFNSPIIVGEYLYRLSSTLRCMKLATGEEIWSQRLGGDFNPSPVATADGRIYYASAGQSWVIQAGPKYELLGNSDLGEPSSASPAVSNRRLFLKGSRNLFCVGKKD